MDSNANKIMPKGGSKGGTRFPRINVQQAFEYSKKLVSKTHTSAQPEKIILPGVFDNSGPIGQVRVSAMKQYNLIDGNSKAYSATSLAKSIASAPKDELTPLLQQAFFFPKIFLMLYETFKGDKTSDQKIRQQAIKLNVHPESSDDFTKIFIESLLFVELGSRNGEEITVLLKTELHNQLDESTVNKINADSSDQALDQKSTNKTLDENLDYNKAKVNAQVNISIDPSMDPEKLEKLLKLLKQYGAL